MRKLAFGLVGIFLIGIWLGLLVGKFSILNSEKSAEIRPVEPTPTPTPEVCDFTVAAVGDVMLGRSVMDQMEKKKDWEWPFRETSEVLKKADLTLGNLEAPLVEGCYQKDNRFILCSKPEAVAALTAAGFDGVSLANNHTLNWGTEGYQQTIKILKDNGIAAMGEDEIMETEKCGVKIKVFGFDDVSRTLDLEQLKLKVSEQASESGLLVALVHWGVEYVDEPTQRQREIASALIDGGVKLIIGHHPHWVQPAEKIGDTLVFWSLGNMVFDQMWSEETRLGEIAEIRFMIQDSRIVNTKYELMPVKIYEYGQPRLHNQ